MQVGVVSANAPGARKRHLARLSGAALAGVALTLTTMGTPAFADNAATGIAKAGNGVDVQVKKGDISEVQHASEIRLAINDKPPVTTYCIDYHHDVAFNNTYQEASWKDSKIKDLGKIQWIVNNSFPKIVPSSVAQTAGADTAGISDKRVEHLVYAATQVAIWSFSDEFVLDEWHNEWSDDDNGATVSEKQYKVIKDVYAYLTKHATKIEEPVATLRIEPSAKVGPIGGKAGPFTVRSGGAEVTLTATGGKLVDADGKAVTKLADGGTFWATSDTGAQVAIKATATGTVPSGRVFVDKASPDKSQKLILAGTATAELVTSATATFSAQAASSSAAGQNTLPVTGASVTVAVATGLVLLAGGALALMVARRRRRVTFTA